MRWVDAARARLRLLLFREEVEQRMDEEFRFHLDMETERCWESRRRSDAPCCRATTSRAAGIRS